MRVISGKYKGRKILIPRTDLRPTLDRTKQTLFNILQFDIEGATVLDLFAGSGSLGIEAHSRGASKVVFVDSNQTACECIKANCNQVMCNGKIYKSDYNVALANMGDKFDIIFIDPPYESDYCVQCLHLISRYRLANECCIIACEHSADTTMPECVDSFIKYRDRVMGRVTFSFYRIKE
ncbi:MAG: 16S rRNA (guanine(966)-N(2))-methyltransferase RsmD [Clostridia bacterium]|nr:16S rRNA (guanine(966)-N(2))-methyltransferase RsmD [Clostridia bacterium]